MKTAAWFALKVIALTVPLTWLWVHWGRDAYGGFLHEFTGWLYGLVGLEEMQIRGSRERYINAIPFLALMLVTPGLSLRRRALGIFGGLTVTLIFHMSFDAIGRSRGGPVPPPGPQISDALPFLLWIVIAQDFLLGLVRGQREPPAVEDAGN